MSQLNYNPNMEIGAPGLKADSGFDNVLSYRAAEDMGFGLGLVAGSNDGDVLLPSKNVAVLLFDADFVASNVISLEVNGEEVEVTYATSQAATLAALAEEINDLEGVSASVTAARQITVVSENGPVLLENVEVTGGASQADSDVSYSGSHRFLGVSLRTHALEQNLEGESFYKEKMAVSVLTRGRVYVLVENLVKAGDSVYMRVEDGLASEKVGQFRSDADSGDAILVERARFVKGAGAGELAVLEVNLP